MDTALVQWDSARQALAQAVTLDEVKDIRDKAEAMRLYLKQAGESLEIQNNVAEIKIRAERKAGVLLKEMPKNEGTVLGGNIVLPPDDTPTLEDLGITKMQSSRMQAVAEVSEDAFEAHVRMVKAAGTDELTTASVMSLSFDSHAAAEEWVIRNQFGRRNLVPYQRAELALKLEDTIAERAKANQVRGGEISQEPCPILDNPIETVDTLDVISKTAGVSRATMHKAKAIAAEAPEEIKEKLRTSHPN